MSSGSTDPPSGNASLRTIDATEPNGPSNRGFKAELLSLNTTDILGQIILCYGGLSCARLVAFLAHLPDVSRTLLPCSLAVGIKNISRAVVGTKSLLVENG